jgi:hypothetical protein
MLWLTLRGYAKNLNRTGPDIFGWMLDLLSNKDYDISHEQAIRDLDQNIMFDNATQGGLQ